MKVFTFLIHPSIHIRNQCQLICATGRQTRRLKYSVSMFKKFFLIITIFLFCTNIIAEEIIMKCKNYRYKYVADSSGISIYAAHIKRDKKKYHKFCPSEVRDDNKHFLQLVEGVEMIINDKKITCLTSKGVLKSGVVTASTSVTDFEKFKRNSEFYWNGKKQSQTEKCKKQKK